MPSIRSGRPSGEFTQHRRLARLLQSLEAHPGGISLEDLSRLLRVSPRSVRRYLSELHRRVPLQSIPIAPGGAHLWRIQPTERSRSLLLRNTQAYALLAGRSLFTSLKGATLYEEMSLITRDLLAIAHRPSPRGASPKGEVIEGLESRFVYVPSIAQHYPGRGEEIDSLFHAVAKLHAIRFESSLPTRRTEASGITAYPYALLLHKGGIFCIAYDTKADIISVFPFHRMRHTIPLSHIRFELPADFSLADYLHGEFGIAPPAPLQPVLIEFDAKMAEEIRWRKVHPTQKIAISSDGRLRLSMRVNDLKSVAAWTLAFGAHAKVIEPPELIKMVIGGLREALKRYAH